MKKSRSITLALVGSALLASGCGKSNPSRTFYDKSGNPVPRSQWKNANGTPAELYDANGNPVSSDVVNQTFASTTGSSSTHSRPYGYSSGLFWALGGPSFSHPRSSYGGPSGSRSGGSSSGSVSRGGFGSTGHAMGGSSSS